MTLRAPFPWFGGKSRVAGLVWERFGDVQNYVEPFAGSLAVLLDRPHEPRIETVNDLDCYVSNFWRALANNPDGVARWADWPVNEADLHARHEWLVNRHTFRERMHGDPDYYDVKIAGWWVWGICQWIGSGWCDEVYWRDRVQLSQQLPHLQHRGNGIHQAGYDIYAYLGALSDRLRNVRVCCGDWSRVCGPTPTYKQGITGVFLDPPYSSEAGRDDTLYGVEDLSVAHEVRAWCVDQITDGDFCGPRYDHPKLRIALCGYDGEHNELEGLGWDVVAWKARGGYGSQNGNGNDNPHKERIWFSPHCLHQEVVEQVSMFDVVTAQ